MTIFKVTRWVLAGTDVALVAGVVAVLPSEGATDVPPPPPPQAARVAPIPIKR